MAYPYPDRNRAQGRDQIEIHESGVLSGTLVQASTNLETTINLPYNSWVIGGMFWSDDNDKVISIKGKPWIDGAQTILGGALALSPLGTSGSATVLTVAITGTKTGHVFRVLSGTGLLAPTTGGTVVSHGIMVEMSCATTLSAGTFEWEFVCVPEA